MTKTNLDLILTLHFLTTFNIYAFAVAIAVVAVIVVVPSALDCLLVHNINSMLTSTVMNEWKIYYYYHNTGKY